MTDADKIKTLRVRNAELQRQVDRLEKFKGLDLHSRPTQQEQEERVRAALNAVAEAVRPNSLAVTAALHNLATWCPHETGTDDYAKLFTALDKYHGYKPGEGMYYPGDPENPEDPGDHTAPFISEAFLYNLLGKEDARSFLSRWHAVLRALGVSIEEQRDRGWA